MSNDDYFPKFPKIIYSNTICLDISKRVGLTDTMKNNITTFYPFTLDSGMRSDQVSYGYYQNPYLDWIIYLTNGIIDPYYGWYLSVEDFEAYIIKKYGSVEDAIRRIRHYKLNWTSDENEISVSFYENNLPSALKKYYTPRFGSETSVVSYIRRREDWITNTNKTVQLTIDSQNDNTFQEGELCILTNDTIEVGSGEIESVIDNIVVIQKITGNTSANNVLVGRTSNAYGNVTHSLVLNENITEDEYVYWTPINYYDWEDDKNERNKFIQLIDPAYTLSISEELRLTMKEAANT
jgi:hypothetical protein